MVPSSSQFLSPFIHPLGSQSYTTALIKCLESHLPHQDPKDPHTPVSQVHTPFSRPLVAQAGPTPDHLELHWLPLRISFLLAIVQAK